MQRDLTCKPYDKYERSHRRQGVERTGEHASGCIMGRLFRRVAILQVLSTIEPRFCRTSIRSAPIPGEAGHEMNGSLHPVRQSIPTPNLPCEGYVGTNVARS